MTKTEIKKKQYPKKNFFQKVKQLKQVNRQKQNLYTQSVCRLIREFHRQYLTNDKPDANFIAKCKTIEFSFVSTEELCKKYAEKSNILNYYESLMQDINRISDQKNRKKVQIVFALNFVRRVIKKLQISQNMNNLLKSYEKQVLQKS